MEKLYFFLLTCLGLLSCQNLSTQNLSPAYFYNVDDYVVITQDSTSESYKQFAKGVSLSYCGMYKESKRRFSDASMFNNFYALNNWSVVHCFDVSEGITLDSLTTLFSVCFEKGYLKSSSCLINIIGDRNKRDSIKIEAAKKGNVFAQAQMGFKYERMKDYDSCFYWYKKVIDSRLKDIHLDDDVLLTQKGTVINWMTNFSSNTINKVGDNYKGLYYYIKGKRARGINILQKEAKRGNIESIKNLAVLYMFNKNYNEAINLLRDYASTDSNGEINLYIGNAIHRGQFFPVSEMISHYEKSASLGNDNAKYNLAICFLKGLYVKKDTAIALGLLSEIKESSDKVYLLKDRILFPDLNSVKETNSYSSLEYQAISYYNREEYGKAIKAFEKILLLNDASIYANYYMGLCYEYGTGVSLDKEKALNFYEKVAFPKEVHIMMR